MATESVPAGTTRGRPRSEKARKAVLHAAIELLEKEGYRATTIEAIAAKSGVAKTTIYRWWPNRGALVVELLMELAAQVAPPPTGKDPVRGLRTELNEVGAAMEALPGRVLGSLVGEAQHDAELRDTLLHGLFHPRRAASAKVFREGQEAGLFRKDVAPLTATELMFAPVFYRGIVRQEPVTQAFVKEVFEAAMHGLEAEKKPAKRRRR